MAIEPFWRRLRSGAGGDYGGYAFASLGGFGVALLLMFATRPGPPKAVSVTDDASYKRLAADLRAVESQKYELMGDLAALQAQHLRLSVLHDEMRRTAIWVPAKPGDVRGEDLIPPQQVPTLPD